MADPNHIRIAPSAQRLCSVEGCLRPHNAHGLCGSHYRRRMAHGDPLSGGEIRPQSVAIKFLTETVLPFDGEECLIWPLSRDSYGYGSVSPNGKRRGVHRVVCEIKNGPPPTPKHYAVHICGLGHTGCVNPKHIRWATPQQNSDDMISHGRSMRGTAQHRAKLTETLVREIRALRGMLSRREIAVRFGVSIGCVNNILLGRSWGWLT